MSRSTIAADYERQLTRHLQEDLNRRLQQVDGIITRPEMALMMINISTSMFLGAQTFVATNAEAETDDGNKPSADVVSLDAFRKKP